MMCPICKTELVITGQARLETLDEHVSCCEEITFKSVYQCPNQSCEACKNELIWNSWGEFYTFRSPQEFKYNYGFIDNNNAPFGSFQRKCNIEVYKDDENFYLIKGINIFKTRFSLKVKFHYTSNENGDILKRTFSLQPIINDCYYTSGISMLNYCMRRNFKLIKEIKKNPENKFFLEELKRELDSKWDKRWWKRLSIWITLRYFNYFFK